MKDFEIIYQTNPSRERVHGYEKHPSIELSDNEYMAQLTRGSMSTIHGDDDKITMHLNTPKIEKTIKEGKENAKSQSKSAARRTKKDNPKSNKPAVESLQAQL